MFIRSLTIDRFRGLEQLTWRPPGRVNCLIGAGDVGKSTILAAIELVLDPRASPVTSEYDYYRRRVEDGFADAAAPWMARGCPDGVAGRGRSRSRSRRSGEWFA